MLRDRHTATLLTYCKYSMLFLSFRSGPGGWRPGSKTEITIRKSLYSYDSFRTPHFS